MSQCDGNYQGTEVSHSNYIFRFAINWKVIFSTRQVYHLELPAIRKSDLVNSVVLDKLQKSAGANYDKAQNSAAAASNTSEFVSYKQSSKAFFQNIEKGSTLGQVTYQTAPMARMTPVDLSHRVMTVGASNAKANLVDLNIRKD